MQSTQRNASPSTGWRRAVICGVTKLCGERSRPPATCRYARDARKREFCTREPFESLVSATDLISGITGRGETLDLHSQMPQSGVIFGD